MTKNAQLPGIGDLAVGRYRILRELGRGGYGVVFQARQEAIHRDVAIKFLLPEVASDPNEVERFRREVFHASGLDHPNTITVFDYGQTPDGLFYVVMEYLQGRTLREQISRYGALRPADCRRLLEQLLGSLDEAHRRQLVHRDLKPENIFLVDVEKGRFQARVLDFGLSKFVGDPRSSLYRGPSLTAEGEICGTPQYMSPEHAYGEDVNPPGDVYSLGLVIYEALIGEPAFDGPSPLDILLKQVKTPTPKLPDEFRNTPMEAFIVKSTQKEPTLRYPDAGTALQWLYRQNPEPSSTTEQAPVSNVPTVLLAPIGEPSAAHARPEVPEEPEEREFQTVRSAPMGEATVQIPTLNSRQFALERFELRLAQVPLIGRRQTLARLDTWLAGALHYGGLCALVGDAGSGKSFVLDTWTEQARAHQRVHLLRGVHSSGSQVLSGLVQAFDGLLGAETTRDTTPLSAERAQVLSRVFDETRSPTVDSSRIATAAVSLAEVLEDLARAEPVLLVLEDIQHADPITLRLLEQLLAGLATTPAPLAVVVTARQNRTLEKISRASAQHLFTHLELGPLSEEDTSQLLSRIFPSSEVLSAGLLRLASGNPALLTHLCRFLIESDRVSYVADRKRWELIDPSTPIEELVPLDLQELVVKRADRYLRSAPNEQQLRLILHRVVLLGDEFDAPLLETCLKKERLNDLVGSLDELLGQLVSSGLIRAVDRGRRLYSFARPLHRASLVRMVESIDDWRQVHRWIAEELIRRHESGLLSATAEAIADHLEKAGADDDAMPWWLRAAEYAEARQNYRHALQLLRRAEVHLHTHREVDPTIAGPLRLQQGRLCRRVGEFGPAEDALREAIEHTRRSDDAEVRARSLELLADVVLKQGRLEQAGTLLDEVGNIYHVLLDVDGKRRIRLARADLAVYRGHYAEARRLFQALRNDLRGTGNLPADVRCLLGLARCDYVGGELLRGQEMADEAFRLAEQVGDARSAASALLEASHLRLFTEGIEASEGLAHQALTLARREQDRLAEANAHLALGLILRRSTHLDRASFHAARARELHESLGHIYGVLKSILLQAEITWLHGDPHAAFLLAEDTARLHSQLGDLHGWALSTLFQALFLIELGRPLDARGLLTTVYEMESDEGLGLYEAQVLFYLGLAHASERNIDEALERFDLALQVATRMNHREIMSLAAISKVRIELALGEIEIARREIPIALEEAEILGHAYCNMFALIGAALLAHIDQDLDALRQHMTRLRTYIQTPNSPQVRIPARLRDLRRLVDAYPPDPNRQLVAAAIDELLRSLAEDE